MPQISETRAGEARASRNSCGGWFRDPLTPPAPLSQAIPPLIAVHIGEQFLKQLTDEGRAAL